MAKLEKLHRSANHNVIAGVMGGIAEYYGWNPNMLRFIVLLVIFASAGVSFIGFVPVYILLVLLMPKATIESYGIHKERRVS